jgi:hypothetical protein
LSAGEYTNGASRPIALESITFDVTISTLGGTAMSLIILTRSAPADDGYVQQRRSPIMWIGLIVIIALVAGGVTWKMHSGSSSKSVAVAPKVAPRAPVAVPLASLAPTQILARTRVAMKAQGSVHSTGVAHDSGITGTFSLDSGNNSGIQYINYATGQVQVLVVGDYTYIRGNSAPLKTFGFSAAEVSEMGQNWLRIDKSDPDYVDITDGVTLTSMADSDLSLKGPVTKLAATTKQGKPVIGLQGLDGSPDAVAGSRATFWIATSGEPLLVEVDETEPSGSGTLVFTKWGEPASFSAPTDFDVYLPDSTIGSSQT